MIRPTRIRVSLLARGTGAVRRAGRTRKPWRRASSHGAHPLEVPAGAAMAKAEVPAQALLRLQSSDARDLRVFNGGGEAVPFALMEPVRAAPAPAPERTARFAALPLFSAAGSARPSTGAMEVRVDEAGSQRSVWVRMDGADVAGAPRLDSVLFATKDEKRVLSGIEVQATLPANTPVRMAVSSSADLAQWSPRAGARAPLPLRGRGRAGQHDAGVRTAGAPGRPLPAAGLERAAGGGRHRGDRRRGASGAGRRARARRAAGAASRGIGRGGDRHRLRHAAGGPGAGHAPQQYPVAGAHSRPQRAVAALAAAGPDRRLPPRNAGQRGRQPAGRAARRERALAAHRKHVRFGSGGGAVAGRSRVPAGPAGVRRVGAGAVRTRCRARQHRSCRLAAGDPRRDPGHAQGRRPARGDGGHAGDPGGRLPDRWHASGPAARARARPPCFGPCCWPACCCWGRWPGRCCGN